MSMFSNSPLLDSAVDAATSSNFEGPAVEGGLYPAVIVGLQDVTSTYEGKEKNGFRLILQYEDDNGKRWHLASKQMDFNLYEKSNFAKFICAWFGCQNTPEEIAKKLRAASFVDESGRMDWSKMLGKPIALNLQMQPSKKDPEKSYVTLMGMQACTKKTGKIEANVEEIPAYLNTVYNGAVNDAIYLDGITFAEPKDKKPAVAAAPDASAAKKTPGPSVTVADAAAFMKPVDQAPVEDDKPEGLPF